MKQIILIMTFCIIATAGQSQTGTKARSAKTGQYVTKDYAKKNQSTTVLESSKPAKTNNNSTTTKKKR